MDVAQLIGERPRRTVWCGGVWDVARIARGDSTVSRLSSATTRIVYDEVRAEMAAHARDRMFEILNPMDSITSLTLMLRWLASGGD